MDWDPLERIDVSLWVVVGTEVSGSTATRWLQDSEDASRRWLHKDTVIPRSGAEQGEDWAEVLSTLVAMQLGVPCARTRLCSWKGRRGSLSLDVCPGDFSLHSGGVALERCEDVEGYFPHRGGVPGVDPARPDVRRPGHNLANIERALRGVEPPPGFDGPGHLGGFEVLTGYLILDALIANRDRHEENWSILVPPLTTPSERLAPSYDHAGSLGYNLTDEERQRHLRSSESLARWARGGTGWRFEHVKHHPRSLVDLAVDALARCGPDARRHWTGRLESLDLQLVYQVLEGRLIGAMSDPAGNFVRVLLEHNLRRLRDGIAGAS